MSYNSVMGPRQKRLKLMSGSDMIPLESDNIKKTKPKSTLQEFKAFCEVMNIPWNPTPN